ncbi:GyrI-like domain-containing protein [Candidatus Bipolaricaulota bacterium]|nr:GyrI-like domain-containing protein [Candidatus Bipolaricaulota bacterium]
MKFEAAVKELPERFVACTRHVGPYPEIGKAIEKMFQWAGPKGLIQFPKTQLLAVYHDDPQKVGSSELRSDACLTVPEGTKGDGAVHTMTIPGGLFAVAHVEIDASEYGAAWDKLVGEWMPENGVESDIERMCYELYLNDPDQHPEKKHIVDICEPVKKA